MTPFADFTAQAFRSLKALLCVALLGVLAACGGKVELMAAMPEAEANEVLAALLNANISADKVPGKDGNVGLRVGADQVARAVDILKAKGLPRERFAGLGDVFKKEGLISSPLEERARYLYALSQELGGTIAQIDGVIAARVHVVLPERGAPGDPNTPSSAAVFIKHQERYNLDTVQPQIRRLVTNSIPGLTPEKVSIVLVASQAGPNPSGASEEPQLAKTVQALTWVLGAMGVLLLAALSGCGWLAWRFWWQPRQAAADRSQRTEPTAA
jgi:type III secretion protein J